MLKNRRRAVIILIIFIIVLNLFPEKNLTCGVLANGSFASDDFVLGKLKSSDIQQITVLLQTPEDYQRGLEKCSTFKSLKNKVLYDRKFIDELNQSLKFDCGSSYTSCDENKIENEFYVGYIVARLNNQSNVGFSFYIHRDGTALIMPRSHFFNWLPGEFKLKPKFGNLILPIFEKLCGNGEVCAWN
jgi:hypothetical protein